MTPFLRGMVEATISTFALPSPVVEIGSYQVEGQSHLIDLRSLFAKDAYLGVDIRPGPGVDRVENVEQMTLPDQSAGTVLALSTLEHVKRFWLGISEIKRIMRPDGILILCTPFYFRIHQHPSDYWRFTTEALDSLLSDHFPQRILGQQGPAKRPSNTWAIAFGPEQPTVSIHQIEQYQSALNRLASTPWKGMKWFRYRLASLISGSKPFEGFLEQDRVSLEVRRGITAETVAA